MSNLLTEMNPPNMIDIIDKNIIQEIPINTEGMNIMKNIAKMEDMDILQSGSGSESSSIKEDNEIEEIEFLEEDVEEKSNSSIRLSSDKEDSVTDIINSLNIGDRIKLITKNKTDKLNDKSGYIIYKTNSFFSMKEDNDTLHTFNYLDDDLLTKNNIDKIEILEKNNYLNYLLWKDIKIGDKIKLHSHNTELNEIEGTLIDNKIDGIVIELEDETEIELDILNGLEPENEIYDIEKLDTQIEGEDLDEGLGIEILEEEDIGEIVEVLEIPENERLYNNQEEFNDAYEQLFSQLPNYKKNKILENEIRTSLNKFIELKNSKTKYSEIDHKIIGVERKEVGHKPTLKQLEKGNMMNTNLIPIVDTQKNLYLDIDEKEVTEYSVKTKLEYELQDLYQLYTKYLNNEYEGEDSNLINYYKKKYDLIKPYKINKSNNGYHINAKQNTQVIRNCFSDNCEYVTDKKNLTNHKLDTYYQSSGIRVSKDINQDTLTSEFIQLVNPDILNIVGFMIYPKYKYYHTNNIDNIKQFYTNQSNLLFNYLEYVKNDKIIKTYINLDSNVRIGDNVVILLNLEGDENYVEGNLLNIETDKYVLRPFDEELVKELEDGILEIEKDENLISITKIKEEIKVGSHVKCCIYQEGETYDLIGKVKVIDDNGIKIIPDNPELSSLAEDYLNKDEVYLLNTEDKKVCFGDKKDYIELVFFENNGEVINKDNFIELCNKIVPSISNILKLNNDKLKNLLNTDDISKYLYYYNITVNDIHYQDFKLIQSIIDENIKNYTLESNKQKITFNQFIDNYRDNKSNFLNYVKNHSNCSYITDRELENKNILDTYGKYPNYLISDDNDITRLNWLDFQLDNGLLFYKQKVLGTHREIKENQIELAKEKYQNEIDKLNIELNIEKEKLEKLKETDKPQINKCHQHKLSKIYYDFSSLNRDNNKEIKYDTDLDDTPLDLKEKAEKEIESKKTELDLNSLLKEKIKEKMKIDDIDEIEQVLINILNKGKKVELGDFALLKDGTDRIFKRELLNEQPVWIISSQQELLSNNKEICELGEKMNCIYQDKHCISEKIQRNMIKIKDIENRIQEFTELKNRLDTFDTRRLLNNNIEDIQKRYQQLKKIQNIETVKYQFKIDTNTHTKKVTHKSKLFKLVNYLMNLTDVTERDYKLSKLLNNKTYVRNAYIDEDSNWLYTVDTDEKLISIHWLLKVRLSLEPNKSEELLQELIDKYGVIIKGSDVIISKIDGDVLREIDEETFEGFEDDEGGMVKTRELLVQDKIFNEKDIIKTYQVGTMEYEVDKYIKDFVKSIYINMRKIDIDEIMKDSITFIPKYITDKKSWMQAEIEKRMKSSKKDKKIDKLKYQKDTKYKKEVFKIIEKEYNKYKSQTILLFVVVRTFIQLQTSIPFYQIFGVYPSCIYSMDGYPLTEEDDEKKHNGITYISCVLNGLKEGEFPYNTLKSLKLDKLRKNIVKILDLWITSSSQIKEKYQLKKTELLEKSKEQELNTKEMITIDNFKPNMSGVYQINELKVKEITMDYIKTKEDELNKHLKSGNLKSYQNSLVILQNILYNLTSIILNEINEILSDVTLEYKNIIQVPLLQNACCQNKIVEEYNYLDFYIGQKPELETKLQYLYYLDNIITKYNSKYTNPYHFNKNELIGDNTTEFKLYHNIKEKDIYSLFIKYSNNPDTFGIERIFNHVGRDIVSGEVSVAFLPKLSLDERIEKYKGELKEKQDKVLTMEDLKDFYKEFNKINVIDYHQQEYLFNINQIINRLISNYSFLFNKKDTIYQLDNILSTNQITQQKLTEITENIKGEIDDNIFEIQSRLEEYLSSVEMEHLYDQLRDIGKLTNLYQSNDTQQYIIQTQNIQRYISTLIISNLSKIKNGKMLEVIEIPKSWKIVDKHQEIVTEFMKNNNDYLSHFVRLSRKLPSYHQLFNNILSNIKNIHTITNLLVAENNRYNQCNKVQIHTSKYTIELNSILLHYIILKLLNYILFYNTNKENIVDITENEIYQSLKLNLENKEQQYKEMMDEKKTEEAKLLKTEIKSLSHRIKELKKTISNSKKEIIIDEDKELIKTIIEDIPDYSGELEKENIEYNFVLSKLVFNIIDKINDETKLINKNEIELIQSVGKSKEQEKEGFINRIDKLSTEAREIDQIMKKHKLGSVWSKGLSSSVWEYSKGDYEDDKNQEDFERKVEQMAKKKYGDHYNEDQLELLKEQMEYNQRNVRELNADNYNMIGVPEEAEDVPANYLGSGLQGNMVLHDELVERYGGLQYGEEHQNIEDYGYGNDAGIGMRLS